MTRAVEICPCCHRLTGDYWVMPTDWAPITIPALPRFTPDELVAYLTERRLLERDEAFAKKHVEEETP